MGADNIILWLAVLVISDSHPKSSELIQKLSIAITKVARVSWKEQSSTAISQCQRLAMHTEGQSRWSKMGIYHTQTQGFSFGGSEGSLPPQTLSKASPSRPYFGFSRTSGSFACFHASCPSSSSPMTNASSAVPSTAGSYPSRISSPVSWPYVRLHHTSVSVPKLVACTYTNRLGSVAFQPAPPSFLARTRSAASAVSSSTTRSTN